jgi:hypothetical protein
VAVSKVVVDATADAAADDGRADGDRLTVDGGSADADRLTVDAPLLVCYLAKDVCCCYCFA